MQHSAAPLSHGWSTLWRDGESDPCSDPCEEGLAQLDRYLDGLGQEIGWLMIFDQRSGQPPIAARTSATVVATPAGRSVTLLRA